MCKGSIPQTFVQRMDLPPLSVSKPDLNFDFPTNSQNNKKPRNRMAPGLFRSLSRTKHPSHGCQHRIAKGKEAILFLHSYAGKLPWSFRSHRKRTPAWTRVLSGRLEVGDQAIDAPQRYAGIQEDLGVSAAGTDLARIWQLQPPEYGSWWCLQRSPGVARCLGRLNDGGPLLSSNTTCCAS